MTINMLIFTIIIKQTKISREEAFHQEEIKRWHDANMNRIVQLQNVI
ncbi:uncharacterized protein (TIGR02413 family) [Peribacillus deserti]|uniref:Uncharacterized protein (TIGR02413 family) n=1 Tax=Peribacillus deserti TaxID=673318 RepID=A0ABS2QFC8_9BACI|nr:YrzI family small protein [Peribacillus deserti]MBM7691851.1 uncharacterized protein (TIGR02413 family) [Peribacillus deserti]